jgi:Tfp pilus assembly protein PilF
VIKAPVTLVALGLWVAVVPGLHGQIAMLDRDLKDVQAWAREDTNDLQRQYYLALAQWKRHHWQEADSLLRFVARTEPRYAEAYLALAYLPYARRPKLSEEEMRGRVPKEWRPAVEEARGFYERAFRTTPLVNLEVMGIELQEPPTTRMSLTQFLVYERYFAWRVDLALGRYRAAYDRLTNLAQGGFHEAAHPDSVPDYILWYRGLAAAHSQLYDAAIGDFRRLLDRALKQQQRDEIVHVPLHDNEYRFMLAALHQMAGHADSAIALYQESLEHDLGLVMAHTYLAGIYEHTGRAEDALLERRRAVEENEDDPAARADLAVSLLDTGHSHEAVVELYRAINLNPRYATPYYLLGRAAELFSQPEQARDEYAQFLAHAPLRMQTLRADAQRRLDSLPK